MFAQSFATFLYAKKFILQMKLAQKNSKINDVKINERKRKKKRKKAHTAK